MPSQSQMELLSRGAVEIIHADELESKIKKKKRLSVKAGFDPTAPDLHLGHTVLIQKMKQFQADLRKSEEQVKRLGQERATLAQQASAAQASLAEAQGK